MRVLFFKRRGLAVLLLAAVSGCATHGPGGADSAASSSLSSSPASSAASAPVNTCKRSRSACKYEGAYEHGEANYAEQEAKRLNQIALQKFRDSIK